MPYNTIIINQCSHRNSFSSLSHIVPCSRYKFFNFEGFGLMYVLQQFYSYAIHTGRQNAAFPLASASCFLPSYSDTAASFALWKLSQQRTTASLHLEATRLGARAIVGVTITPVDESSLPSFHLAYRRCTFCLQVSHETRQASTGDQTIQISTLSPCRLRRQDMDHAQTGHRVHPQQDAR